MRACDAMVVVAALLGGCFDPAEEPYEYETSAYVVSSARETLDLEVFRPLPALSCESLDATAASLTASDLSASFCARLKPGELVPLDRDFRGGDDELGKSYAEEPPCDAVMLRARALSSVLVYWQKTEPLVVSEDFEDNTSLSPSAVYIEPVKERLYIAGSAQMPVIPFTESIRAVDCSSLRRPKGLSPSTKVPE